MRSPWPRNLVTRLESSRLVAYSLVAGALVGVAGLMLRWALGWLAEGAYRVIGYRPPGTPGEGGLMMSFGALVPWGLGALVAAALLVSLFGGRQRDPLEDAVAAYHGSQPPEQPLPLARTLLVQGVGNAAGLLVGRDALFALAGGLVARLGWRTLRLDAADAQTLALACVAAGLGLALHAPLAAAVLVAEALYRRFEFELELLLPAVLTSIAAYAVYGSVYGFAPLFQVSAYTVAASTWVVYAGLALAVTLVAWVAVRLGTLSALTRVTWTGRALIALAYGAATAALFTQVPEVLGDGSGWLQIGLSGLGGPEMLWQGLLRAGLLVLALLGGLGQGVLPAVSAGGLIGVGVATLWPGLQLDPAVAGLVGAGAFLTVTHNAPIAATLLAVTWGGDALLPAAFIGTLLAHWVSGETSLLTTQVRTRAASGAHALAPAPPLAVTPLPSREQQPDEGAEGGALHRLPCPPSWAGQPAMDVRWPTGVQLVGVVHQGAVQEVAPGRLLTAGDELLVLAEPGAYRLLAEALQLGPVMAQPARA